MTPGLATPGAQSEFVLESRTGTIWFNNQIGKLDQAEHTYQTRGTILMPASPTSAAATLLVSNKIQVKQVLTMRTIRCRSSFLSGSRLVIKFWLALILGTVTIAAGLTYLKLHRGAQTISYPPPAPKTKPPLIEYQNTQPDTDEKRVEISANVVTFHVKESKADKENEVMMRLKNTGEGPLELSLKHSSCTCAKIYLDSQLVTMTDHLVKIPAGQSALLKLIYKPKFDPNRVNGDKLRITATFAHNDERYNDDLHFEIVTDVKQ
jgi:hypothetical protein